MNREWRLDLLGSHYAVMTDNNSSGSAAACYWGMLLTAASTAVHSCLDLPTPHQAAIDPEGAGEDVDDSEGDQDGSDLMSALMGEVSVASMFAACCTNVTHAVGIVLLVRGSNRHAVAPSSNVRKA